MRLSEHCTVYSTVITHYTPYIHYGRGQHDNANEQIEELITRESYNFQNGYYKITCQCENTILRISALTLFAEQ